MIRLGIDARNMLVDRRGMGRVVRGIVKAALQQPELHATLVAGRRRDVGALRKMFSAADVRSAGSASRRGRYDVVWFPWNGMPFSAAAPSVLTLNDAFAFTHPATGGIARAREQQPIRRAVREATRIVSPSQWSRDEIARVLSVDAARFLVIPYGADPFFRPGRSDVLSGSRFVLMVGVREQRKNARVVIDACALAFSDPAHRLVVVGELAQQDMERIAHLRVRTSVFPHADDEVLRDLYRAARAVAVPSTAEGFGLVAVEAMACGTAVFAADAAALPESTAGAALLLEPHDVAAWRDAIGRVLDDDGFAMSLAARGAARFAFASRSAPARAYLRLFRTVAGAS